MASSWNHNTHFHPLLLRLLPERRRSCLDVGCGDGAFASLLARRCTEVIAIDADATQVAIAADRCAQQPNVRVQQADFLASRLPDEHFDVVTAVAAFHHMPLESAVDEARRVLKPGGRLVVLGVWTDNATPVDLAFNLASTGLNMLLRLRRGPDAMTAPSTMERTSWAESRGAVAHYLPGARMKRRLLWRYTLEWEKPLAPPER